MPATSEPDSEPTANDNEDADHARVERHRLALSDAIGAVADDLGLTDDGPRALIADVFNLVERYRSAERGQPREQSGSGQQPPPDGVRSAAGRDADDPDTRGATASIPGPAGEPGAMPDADDDSDPDYEHRNLNRPFWHDHPHQHAESEHHAHDHANGVGHHHGHDGYDHHAT